MDTTSLRRYQGKLLIRREQLLTAVGRLKKENQELAGRKQLDWLDQARDENEIRLLDRLSEG